MKITKSQLKQIIKEELKCALNEDWRGKDYFFADCDKTYGLIELDAKRLYSALKGLDPFSTGEKKAKRVMNTYSSRDCIVKLNSAFDRVLRGKKEDPDTGDLADWLIQDGLDDEWLLVRSIIPKRR